MEKELLKKLGEETIYSAKGHFKSCDIRRNLVTTTIWLCALVNVFGILGLETPISKVISVFGLLGTIALLLWNEGDGKNYRARHKGHGEKYLAIHKEIRACYLLDNCNSQDIKRLSDKVQEIDKENKPDISIIARRWAKKAIEKTGETDNWFKE